MADSVQNRRRNWFYIKDQKTAKSDLYGLAPFDASKSLKKLNSWDALPSESEAEEIKPLLTRIAQLKDATNKELNGTQLIVFFLQCRIQPLHARVSKLWAYSGSKDQSRESQSNLTTKELEKKVCSFTKLTKRLAVPACLVTPYKSKNSLPKVCKINPIFLCS
jgi:hypothetical protein